MSDVLSSRHKGVRWGWIIAGLVIAFLVIGFAVKAIDGMVTYYVTADEFVNNRADFEGKRMKVAGKATQLVQNGDIYNFTVTYNEKSFPVRYQGLAPDTFKNDVDVVVEGRAQSQETFEASVVMAKCASKYEAGGLPPLEQMKRQGL